MRAHPVVLGALLVSACAMQRGSAGHSSLFDCSNQVPTPETMTTEQVRLVQRSLADKGIAVQPSGALDRQTVLAVQSFQRARGIAPTGALNSPTIEALGIDSCAVAPHPEFPDRDPVSMTSYLAH